MKYNIQHTSLKGKSVFAVGTISRDEFIGEYYRDTPNDQYTKNIFGFYDRELGRYCNHGIPVNTYVVKVDGGYDLYALCDIQDNQEIVVDYQYMEQLSNTPKGSFFKEHFINEVLYHKGPENII